MTHGELYLVAVPSGYNPYVLVGWVEICGLEIHVRNARVIRRFGANMSLAELAAKGPASDTQLLAKSETEELWRPNIGRAIKCNVAAWKRECPKPKNMETE